MSIEALEARWDGFLSKARERFEAVMNESLEGCAALLQQTGGDTITVSNAWTGMRLRAIGLAGKIEETWSQQVQDQFIAANTPTSRLDANHAKGEALRDWMDIEIERVEIKIFADGLRSMLDAARAEQAELRCSQCGAELPIGLTLRTVEVNCARCGSLITVEPGPRARMAEALGHYLWREATWDLWLRKQAAETAHKRSRGTQLPLLQAWELAELEYLSAWLRERAKLMLGAEKEFDKDLIGRMRQFYLDLEREAVWTKAGRPKQIDRFLTDRARAPA
jgi:DNA-directed RNA polymerase subunit RPC12/RpoP